MIDKSEVQQISCKNKAYNALMKCDYLKAMFDYKIAVRHLITSIMEGKSANILNCALIVADAKDKYKNLEDYFNKEN